MKKIYTCPYCGNQYTVRKPGNYACACGVRFNYPEILSSINHNYASSLSDNLDCSSRSMKRNTKFHCSSTGTWLKRRTKKNCPCAVVSLVLALLGLVGFGVLSLPAIISGYFAKDMISTPGSDYKGSGLAVSGIALGVLGCAVWAVILFIWR